MNRRRFLIASGGAVPWGWAARADEAPRIVASQNEALEERLAAWIQIYDTQGNHRTGTEADLTAAQWLAAELHRVGLAPTLEPFEFSRVVPQSCYLRIGDRRVDGVPAFDAAFTGAGGIRGRIGPLGSYADIGLAETRPFAPSEPAGVLAESRPERPCVFVGLSGHELANLGLLDYVKRRPHAYRQAHRWIHYGANIGVPHQPNLVHVADDELGRWAASTLKRQGLAMNAAPREDLPRGEGLLIHRGGARYVTLTCGTNLFHNAADRWPEEVDVRELARYALSFSNALRDAARLT